MPLSTIFFKYNVMFSILTKNKSLEKVCHLRQVGGFPPGPPVSSINKSDHHDIAEILLKVALNTIT
jgi:hypothetical protein